MTNIIMLINMIVLAIMLLFSSFLLKKKLNPKISYLLLGSSFIAGITHILSYAFYLLQKDTEAIEISLLNSGFSALLILLTICIGLAVKKQTEFHFCLVFNDLPMKQANSESLYMSGSITEEENRRQKKAYNEEVSFYGNLEGSASIIFKIFTIVLCITPVALIIGFILGKNICENITIFFNLLNFLCLQFSCIFIIVFLLCKRFSKNN